MDEKSKKNVPPEGLSEQTPEIVEPAGAVQQEDAVMKTMMQFFADELLPRFGIEGKVVTNVPTELVYLELKKLNQDFNLVMEDGTWKHFEFQSTNEGLKGLKRFRTYESLASYQYHVSVTTYVLYSGTIKNPMTEFTEGINTYRVIPIIMRNKDASKVIHRLNHKIKTGEPITREDLAELALCPLMGGDMGQKERIKAAYKITRQASSCNPEDIRRIEAVIYAMADKFLESLDMEDIKEDMLMTRLGQMLVNEGREEGREQTILRQICKKLAKGKSPQIIAEELEEDEKEVEAICNAAQKLAPDYDAGKLYDILHEDRKVYNNRI